YWVYILASQPRGTLYIGVTNNILGRLEAHRVGKGSVFTSKYRVAMLVYYEEHADIRLAIQREKTLKHYVRDWKINLIERENPRWVDLYPQLLALRGGRIDPAGIPMDPRDKPEDDI
ncbi:MAG: GIY-YIG nuclease family protein, partial [Hyphomicrobium sp.]